MIQYSKPYCFFIPKTCVFKQVAEEVAAVSKKVNFNTKAIATDYGAVFELNKGTYQVWPAKTETKVYLWHDEYFYQTAIYKYLGILFGEQIKANNDLTIYVNDQISSNLAQNIEMPANCEQIPFQVSILQHNDSLEKVWLKKLRTDDQKEKWFEVNSIVMMDDNSSFQSFELRPEDREIYFVCYDDELDLSKFALIETVSHGSSFFEGVWKCLSFKPPLQIAETAVPSDMAIPNTEELNEKKSNEN